MAPPSFTAGRMCLTLVSLNTILGPYFADWNETHVKNPKWPPHARFHNGQTMSMGLLLGLLTQYFLWRPTQHPLDSRLSAALVSSIYFSSGMSAILYPGAKWLDPEFGTGAPQIPV